MRNVFTIALLASLLFSGGYFYYIAEAVCPVPLTYRLGVLDERFNLSEEKALLAIAEAESVWEDATGRNLFSYQDNGDIEVNFIFDERQQLSNAEDVFKEKLDTTENISDQLRETYAELVATYNTERQEYTVQAAQYEKKLQIYNQEVEKYNKQGGAPASVYAVLNEEQKALADLQTVLNSHSQKLNTLVSEINNVGEKTNVVITTYNQNVGLYNKTFGESREFTQGDYSGEGIKVYTFETPEELTLVLVHELGHALSLNHVEGEASVMHYLLGGQQAHVALSEEDLVEFNRVCGEKSLWEKLRLLFERV